MNLLYPSRDFDDAVAAVCHGQASDAQMEALNALLRTNQKAQDEYLLRVELHARLASESDLFADIPSEAPPNLCKFELPGAAPMRPRAPKQMAVWAIGLAACFVILATLAWHWKTHSAARQPTSAAVAVLNRSVEARWDTASEALAAGSALEPGWLRLKSGLIQVAFYSGARVVIQGPAQVKLVSAGEAFCQAGKMIAEVPPQARGFLITTPQMNVTDLGTEFGLDVKRSGSEVHVFKGEVECQVSALAKRSLKEGEASIADGGSAVRLATADKAAFAPLFDLQRQWLALLAGRYEAWRKAGAKRNQDPSLLVRFDFEQSDPRGWVLPNVAARGARGADAAIVGCQGAEGRWPGKRALEFGSMSDRVRFQVPGEFRALTFSAWVNVKGLDRQFNSLFMCDGYDAGKVHWQIRNDGVLDMGVQGPRARDVQIFASPPVVGLNQFGQWMHVAAVLDGEKRQVIQYVNGMPASRHALQHLPPYRLGAVELGNWNSGNNPNKPPFLIRHFSGAMDEFSLFNRALSDAEIQALYAEGKPLPDP